MLWDGRFELANGSTGRLTGSITFRSQVDNLFQTYTVNNMTASIEGSQIAINGSVTGNFRLNLRGGTAPTRSPTAAIDRNTEQKHSALL